MHLNHQPAGASARHGGPVVSAAGQRAAGLPDAASAQDVAHVGMAGSIGRVAAAGTACGRVRAQAREPFRWETHTKDRVNKYIKKTSLKAIRTRLSPRREVDRHNVPALLATLQITVGNRGEAGTRDGAAFGQQTALHTTCALVGHGHTSARSVDRGVGRRHAVSLGRAQHQGAAAGEVGDTADGSNNKLGQGRKHVVVAAEPLVTIIRPHNNS